MALRMDDFVSKVVTDPKNPPNTLLLKGFIGASSEEGHIRLYLDDELSDYLEIPESAVLYSREIAKEKSPVGGSYIWIQRDATLIHGPVATERPKASFLEGRIMTAQASGASGPLLLTLTGPGCNTILDGCTDAGPKCPTQITCPAPCRTQSGTTCPAVSCTHSGPNCQVTSQGSVTCVAACTQNGPNCQTTPLFTCSGPSCPTTPDTTCCGPNCPTFPPNTCGGPRCATVSGTTCPAPCPPPTQHGTTCPAPCPPATQHGTTCPAPCPPPTQLATTCPTPCSITKTGPPCHFPTEAGKTCVAPCVQP